jgi:hypothetical protein
MFDLRRPCVSCPFRKGQGERFHLPPDRLREIMVAPSFQCHKTVDYDTDPDNACPGDRPQQCAGLMALLHRIGQPNQIMQVASRLGALDLGALDPRGEAYPDRESAMRAHASPERRRWGR